MSKDKVINFNPISICLIWLIIKPLSTYLAIKIPNLEIKISKLKKLNIETLLQDIGKISPEKLYSKTK